MMRLVAWIKEELRPAAPVSRPAWSTAAVLFSAPFFLTLRQALASLSPWPDDRLLDLAWWVCGQVSGFLIGPLFILLLVTRERPADYGLKLRGALKLWWVYAAMFAAMIPIILVMATTREFQEQYPFYQPPRSEPLYPRFLAWQLLYAAQFIALEFFFRGYLIHGLKPDLGPYAILVSTVPYCMIHFGKPLPETIASIFAGVILGFMSYTTRSIWLGAALHIAVAVSMDFAALWNEGVLSLTTN